MVSPQPQDDQECRLAALLAEDTASPEEARELGETVRWLRRWPAPPSDPARRAQLIAALAAAQSTRRPALRDRLTRAGEWWPWLLLQAQARVVRREVLWASALVLGVGALVTAAVYDPAGGPGRLPLVLLAPLVAAAGMALLYSDQVEQALELERSTPVPLVVLLLARLMVVFVFNCGAVLAGSLLLVVLHPGLALWPLVLAWLAPMAFLSSLAFFLSVVSRDPLVGIVVSALLWVLLSLGRIIGVGTMLAALPEITAANAQPWLWAAALLCGLLGLGVAAGRGQRAPARV